MRNTNKFKDAFTSLVKLEQKMERDSRERYPENQGELKEKDKGML